MQNAEPKRTVLYPAHVALGARFTEFGGWQMPVYYRGVAEEHLAVRRGVGLFDVSHMGEIQVSGPRAAEFLQYVTTNDLRLLENGRAQYALLLNDEGGVVDDIIVYMRQSDEYLLCVNAANTDTVFSWLKERNQTSATVRNRSAEYAQLALQGPQAQLLLEVMFGLDEGALNRSNFRCFSQRDVRFGNIELLVARTGYTGEDGFELFIEPDSAFLLWDALIELGEPLGILPVGLGARDTLRLEAAFPLHGHELRPDMNALGAAAQWALKLDKGEFIGRRALLEAKACPKKRKLVGFEVTERGIAREGMTVFDKNGLDAEGRSIGIVTSGTKTPLVERPIGLALVDAQYSSLEEELFVDVRGKQVKIKVVKTPFYQPTA